MKYFTKPHAKVMITFSAIVLTAGIGATVLAAIPSVQGMINGCYSNQNGQLKVIDSSDACGAGQTALNWDKGVLAYGFLGVDDSDPNNRVIILNQNRGIESVALSPIHELAYCIELSGSLESDMRFPHVQATSWGAGGHIAALANTSATASMVSAACGSTADVLIDMNASSSGVYFSVF